MNRQFKKVASFVLVLSLVMGLFAGILQGKTVNAETTAIFEPTLVENYSSLPYSAQTMVTLQGSTAASPVTVVPVKVNQAGVIEFGITGKVLGASVEVSLFSDANCLAQIGTPVIILPTNQQMVDKQFPVPAAGTYYLRFKWSSAAAPASAGSIQLDAYAYQGDEITLGSNLRAIYTADYTKTLYHKLVVKKSGLVAVTGNSYQEVGSNLQAGNLAFTLCNAKKNTLYTGSLNSLNDYTETLSLKKGTYYVAVTSDLRYQLSRSTVSWKDQSGASKAKAKLIKKGKKVKGMVLMTDSTKKVDWFKVKLSKRSKLQLNIGVRCSGSGNNLKVEIVPANRHYHLLNASSFLGNSSGRKLVSRTKLNRGTYYIKVTKLSKSFSGVYQLQQK